jgi:hypothetical protein
LLFLACSQAELKEMRLAREMLSQQVSDMQAKLGVAHRAQNQLEGDVMALGGLQSDAKDQEVGLAGSALATHVQAAGTGTAQ